MKNINYWKLIEENIDKLLHKIKIRQFPVLIEILNKKLKVEELDDQENVIKPPVFRASKDLFQKFVTILPIHIENLTLVELFTVCDMLIDNKIVNDRLLVYFIYPRFEQLIPSMMHNQIIKLIDILIYFKFDVNTN